MKVPKLTIEQAAIISVYTGITCCNFSEVQKLGDELMERPTWTHEYANEKFAEELKSRCKKRFLSICVK